MRSHPLRATIMGALAAASCAGSLAARLDTAPPALLSFKPAAVADAALPAGGFTIDLQATDDLSGVQWIDATAMGPDGSVLSFSAWEFSPGKALSRSLSHEGAWAYLRPGTYTFVSARMSDVAGNTVDYDQAALAALGATSFTLKNTTGFDATPPQLVSGKVLTPTISASALQPGTNYPANVGVGIEARDAGNTATSGVGIFSADFCEIHGGECMQLGSYGFEAKAGSNVVKLRGGTWVSVQPGEYHLKTLTLTDRARNTSTLTSTEFGGTTDFSAYFPSVAITVTP